MIAVHRAGPHTVQKELKDTPRFILTNARGSFLQWNEQPTSRYDGLFVRLDGTLARTLARITHDAASPVRRAVNHFSHIELERTNGLTERYFLHPEKNALVWDASEPVWVSVEVDGKELFNNEEWERFYTVSEESHTLTIEFTKRKNGVPALHFYMAIAGGAFTFELPNKWISYDHTRDQERRDPPYSRFVFQAAHVKGKRFAFAVAKEKHEAQHMAEDVYKHADVLMRDHARATDRYFSVHDKPIKNSEVRVARLAALHSLVGMSVYDSKGIPEGMWAGLPWLAQFWMRDFALSTNQLDPVFALSLVRRSLKTYQESGTIPSCAASLCMPYADTEGMLFLSASLLRAKGLLTRDDEAALKDACVHFVDIVLPRRMKGGFVWSGPKETWMDSEYQGSARAGVRIEIQALAVKALELAYELTSDRRYMKRRDELLRAVRASFWDGERLLDGLSDTTQRPNAFLAYHIAPNLLFSHEWVKAFDHALKALWLTWGGLATIPSNHPLFCGRDRGCVDPNQSYHHGNSWFFINNIAVSALFQVDSRRFKTHIDALLASATRDILWEGALGHASEVSSADRFSPGGCSAQSWSAATYCDALDVMLKSKLL